MCGWGYDIASMPTPADDTDPTQFNLATPRNRSLWKTGPVDLMWDDERQVWCGGLLMVEGVLSADLQKPVNTESPTTASVELYRSINGEWTGGKPRKGPDGQSGATEEIVLVNRDTSLEARAGAYVLAVRINYEWRPLVVTCTSPPSSSS